MKNKNLLATTILMLIFLAFSGAVGGLVYASTTPIKTQPLTTPLEFMPETGIRYNPALNCFDVLNYYGLTWIGTNAVVDTIGTVTPTGGSEVTNFSKKASADASYRQVCDIEFKSNYKSTANANSSFPSSYTFSGTYDGQGYQLVNCPTLQIGGSGSNYTSLFAASSGIVKNVRIFSNKDTALANSTSSGNGKHSLLVYDNSGTIDSCISNGFISSDKSSSSLGVFAHTSSGTIKNCTNNMDITFTSFLSQLAGIVYTTTGGTIHSNINNGKIEGASFAIAGIIGSANVTTSLAITFNTNNGNILSSDPAISLMIGGIVGIIDSNVADTEVLVKNNFNIGKVEAKMRVAGGIIGGVSLSSSNTNFIILNNINDGEIKAPDSVGGIIGDCLTSSGTSTITNIFGNINNANVIAMSTIVNVNVGGIVGKYDSRYCESTIEANINTGNIILQESSLRHTGGIIGFLDIADKDINVKNNYNNGKVESTGTHVSGIIGGYNAHSTSKINIIANTNDGNISGLSNVGGVLGGDNIQGQITATTPLIITNNTNNGNISATLENGKANSAGIAGSLWLLSDGNLIESNKNTGNVTAIESKEDPTSTDAENLGGIIGYLFMSVDIELNNNYNLGNIEIWGAYVGGILGCAISDTYAYITLSITNNTNKGEIKGWRYLGGIAGSIGENTMDNFISVDLISNINDGRIENNKAISGYKTGGIAGVITSLQSYNILHNKNNGIIVSGSYTAGIVGDLAGDASILVKVQHNSNNAAITGKDSNVAGIIGALVGPFDISYNINNGIVLMEGSLTFYCAGIVGHIGYGSGGSGEISYNINNNDIISEASSTGIASINQFVQYSHVGNINNGELFSSMGLVASPNPELGLFSII